MNKVPGSNQLFWKAEKYSLILLVVGLYLSDTFYTSLILGIAGLLYFVKLPRINNSLDREHFLLLLSFLLIFLIKIIVRHDTIYWSAHLCLTPLFLYQLGRYYMKCWQSEDNLLLLLMLLAISLGSVHIIITIQDIIQHGLVNPERLLGVNEDVQRAITQRATEISLCFSGFAFLFYVPCNRFQRVAKQIIVVIGVLALMCGVHYVSRTCLFLFLISLLLGVFMPRNIKGKTGSGNVLFVTICVLFFFFIIGGFSLFSQLFRLYQMRGIQGEQVVTAGGRLSFWMQSLAIIFQNPFGTKVDFFAHNLWLDIGLQFGIFPFIFLVCFSISNFRKAFRIVRRKQESMLVRLCVCSFSVLFFLSCFTEPIHVSAPNYLFVYMMFCGIVNAIYKRKPWVSSTVN